VKRYWRIYRSFVSSSLTRELEYRGNFIAKILQNLIWVFFFVLIVGVIYRNTDNVAGWKKEDMLLLTGACFLVTAIIEGFAMSLMEVPGNVRDGTLDLIVTRPVDSQFWVSSRRFNFDRLGVLAVALGMVIYYGSTRNPAPDLVQWVAFAVLTLCAIALYYSLNLFFMTLGIYWVKVDNLWVLGETTMQVSRYPIDIYGVAARRFFFFYLPLAFFASAPVSQIRGEVAWTTVAGGVAWAAFGLTASRMFWRHAMRSYSSASS